MTEVVQGFSTINRWLLYTSLMLTPAQALSGVGSNCPSNIGFLAYNWYNQIVWYRAIKAHELHALSLLPVHFNTIYVFTYLGGVTSGNIVMGVILGFGTAALMVFNSVAAWTSWAIDLPQGYGIYQFFFFGWRTLTPGWRKFILLWQIADSMLAFNALWGSLLLAINVSLLNDGGGDDETEKISLARYPAVILGPALVLFCTWPLILWTELIVSRNHIISETDMIAVWLFVAQVVAMLLPSCSLGASFASRNRSGFTLRRLWRRRDKNATKEIDSPSNELALQEVGGK